MDSLHERPVRENFDVLFLVSLNKLLTRQTVISDAMILVWYQSMKGRWIFDFEVIVNWLRRSETLWYGNAFWGESTGDFHYYRNMLSNKQAIRPWFETLNTLIKWMVLYNMNSPCSCLLGSMRPNSQSVDKSNVLHYTDICTNNESERIDSNTLIEAEWRIFASANQAIIDSHPGLSSIWCQFAMRTNTGLLLLRPQET